MRLFIRVHDLVASRKFFRRTLLVSCIIFFGFVIWRVTPPEVLTNITPAGAGVVATVLGPLTAVFLLYQWMSDRDER